jgi:hypothetical protein
MKTKTCFSLQIFSLCFLCALCAPVAKLPAQTPVTISTVNIYGPAANATVTFRPVHQIGINYPNYVLGDSISVTPTNGVVATNLLEGPYIISFSGQFASQRVYVPGLWITNMGYTLPLNLASDTWQFPVGTATIIVTNSGSGGGGSNVTVVVANTITASPGSQAAVTNVGTADAVILQFTIPQGVAGATGPAGSSGTNGATGATGPAGSNGINGTNGLNGTNLLNAITNLVSTNVPSFILGNTAFVNTNYDPAGMARQATNMLAVGIAGTYLAQNGNGSGLTGLNASQITSGTVPAAQLGSGTAGSATFLRGDQTWATPGESGGSTTTNFGSPIFFTNSATTNVVGIPEINFAGTNGAPNGPKSLTIGIGNWYGSNSIGYFQAVAGPISLDLLPPSGTTNMANLDLCAWFDPATKQGQYADIAIRPNGSVQQMYVGGIGSGAPPPSLWLDSQDGGISVGTHAYLSMADYPGYQNILSGFTFEAAGNLTTYAGYGSAIQIAAGGVDPNAVGWLAWAFINNTNHNLQLVPQGGYVSVNGYLTATNGLGSFNTNGTLVVAATGITNITGVNYRIFGFTGVSVTQTNPISKIGFSRGTITTPTDIILQPNEFLNGSTCAALAGQAF